MCGARARTPLVLAGSVVGDEQSSLPQLSAPLIGAGLVGGALALAAAAAVFVRFPRAVIPVALATIAFRVPIELGGDSVKLLLPLYLTIGGAVVARAWSYWRGRAVDAPRAPQAARRDDRRVLALYAIQSLVRRRHLGGDRRTSASSTRRSSLLYGLAAAQKWDAKLLRACAATLVTVALVLVFAGFIEFARGRYLITIGGITAVGLRPVLPRAVAVLRPEHLRALPRDRDARRHGADALHREDAPRARQRAVLLAVLWAGLVLSLSQSSFAALLSGLIVLAALRWKAQTGADRHRRGAAGRRGLRDRVPVGHRRRADRQQERREDDERTLRSGHRRTDALGPEAVLRPRLGRLLELLPRATDSPSARSTDRRARPSRTPRR